jgi:hypothetical protein
MITVQEPARVSLKWELGAPALRTAVDRAPASERVGRSRERNTGIDVSRPYAQPPSKFPICAELVLLDSKKSIRTGVKNAVVWYRQQARAASLDYLGERDPPLAVDVAVRSTRMAHGYVPKGILKSSLLQGKLLKLVQRRLHRLVDERFAACPVLASFKTCIVNGALQDFQTEDLSAIYNKLFRREGKERINEIIDQSYYEKYPLQKLDDFYDELFGVFAATGEIDCALHKPSFYTRYTDIWQLNRLGFKEYGYQCFVEYCEEQQQLQYDYDEDGFVQEAWRHARINQAVLMNVDKFYFYFSRKVEPFREGDDVVVMRRNRRRSSASVPLAPVIAQLPHVTKNSIETVLNCQMRHMQHHVAVELSSHNCKLATVGFDEELMVLEFCPAEPSYVIGLDKDYV